MAHFVAVLSAEVARAPEGIESPPFPSSPFGARRITGALRAQQKAHCIELLDAASLKHPTLTRSLLGNNGSGFVRQPGPYCSYAYGGDGVHVIMTGEVAEWPRVDAVAESHNAFMSNKAPAEADDAHWLLDFYRTFDTPNTLHVPAFVMDRALECLAAVRGNFAFVIFDEIRHRVLAARDREGTLFSSSRNMIAYSPGERGWMVEGPDVPGHLHSFVEAEDHAHYRGVRAIPRINSQGTLCGTVFRVASKADMARPVTHM